jgi:hypothetical protein
MKRTILTIIVTLFSFIAFSQTSSGVWNSKTANYTNTTHKITWQLIEDFEWIGRPILEESTLLKVRNDDTHIMIKLGATKAGKFDGDIWEYVSMYESSEFVESSKQLAAHNGMEYLGTKAIKSQLCGIHAVKTRTDMKKYYPEHKQTVHSIEITYSLYKNEYIYTVSVTALSVLEEEIADFDRIATQIFNGFKIK